MTPVNIAGAGNLPCWEHPIRKRFSKTDVDILRGTYVTSDVGELVAGQVVPGFPGMIIFGLELVETKHTRRWQLDAQGSLDGSNPTKIISRGSRRTLDEGWDVRSLRVVTWDESLYPLGAVHPDHPYLYLYDRDADDEDTDWKYLSLTYKGLEEEKPFKRRMNSGTESSESSFSGFSVVTGEAWVGFPPAANGAIALSGTNLTTSYEMATISVTDTMISLTEPPAEMVGKAWTPESPPTVTSLVLAGSSTKYHFPFNWVCRAMTTENIPGTTLHLISLTWEFQRATTPTGA